MHRFFIKTNVSENQSEIIIDEKSDVKHITKALRVRIGEEIEICDSKGDEYITKVTSLELDRVLCDIISKVKKNRESNISIELYQGLAKGSKMDTIIQKSVELGVNKVIPMMTKRSIVKLDKKSESKKIERWQKIADEAAKQSKRSFIPIVENVMDIKEVIEKSDSYDLMIIAYELESTQKLKEIIRDKEYKNIAVLIGPEGGFSEEEVSKSLESGLTTISLGKRILRTETAGVTCISILQYELGDLG